MTLSTLLYALPVSGVIISVSYVALIIKSSTALKEKAKLLSARSTEDFSSENKSENNTQLDSRTEIYSINYSEAHTEPDSKIEIERNMRPYFDALIKYVHNTKQSLCVMDYLEHGKELEQDKPFFHALRDNHNRYFSAVEELVKNNENVEYIRILQLPLGTNEDFTSDEAKVKSAIGKLYNSTQHHINRVLELKNFKLYVISKACTNYSEVIIDNRFLFVELDRYDQNSRAKPNRLIINKAEPNDSFSKTMQEEYSFIKYVLTNQKPVTRQQIDIAIREIDEDRKVSIAQSQAIIAQQASTVKAFAK